MKKRREREKKKIYESTVFETEFRNRISFDRDDAKEGKKKKKREKGERELAKRFYRETLNRNRNTNQVDNKVSLFRRTCIFSGTESPGHVFGVG